MIESFELHDDNMPGHTALSVDEFLAKRCILVVLQVHNSPDLLPCDFYFLPELKLRVKGCHIPRLDSIQKVVTDAIKTAIEADFQYCHEAWKLCWAKCVASEGCYFEGDIVD
jgi:hypothetical protein